MKKLSTLITSLFIAAFSYSQDCIDFSNYTTAYVDSVTQDNVNFPAGTTFITDGDIQLVKIDQTSFFQGIQGDSALFYIGNLDIDVSTSSCSNKILTFNTAYVEQLVIDGDTVFSFVSTPAFYQGNGFTVDFSGSGLGSGDFTITGDFDQVRLLGSTNILSHVCLDCNNSSVYGCVDFSQYTTAYVDSVTFDHVNFPIGSTFISDGSIDLVKIDTTSYFQGIQGDSALFYIGNLAIDVSNANCANKTLTFSSAYIERMLVDGDTIYNFTSTPPFFQGNGYTVQFVGSGLGSGDFTISGDFDEVVLLGSTNILTHVCLDCEIQNVTDCLDFGMYTTAYVDSVTFDHVNFPIGSTFLSDGSIEIIKIDTTSYFQGIQGDSSLFYIGNLGIDVSTANCMNKTLTFSTIYVERMLVDGDTIFNFTSTPAFFQGNGYTVNFVGSGLGSGTFTITGDFNVVTLLGSTNFLSHVCLSCFDETSCMDFSGDFTYMNDVNTDHMTYPVGDPFYTSGGIALVKTDSTFTQYMGSAGDSAFIFVGSMIVDLSVFNCPIKTLSFWASPVQYLIINGDTVYVGGSTGMIYQQNGAQVFFTATGPQAGYFEISGTFDDVYIMGITTMISDVCASCNGLLEAGELVEEQNEFLIYPNPTSSIVNLKLPELERYHLRLFNMNGAIVQQTDFKADQYQLNVQALPNGIYFLNIMSNSGWYETKKIIKQ